MTAEEFEQLALALFEDKSENPDRFNPIIDAAKELADQGIKINHTNPKVLVYTLILLKKYDKRKLTSFYIQRNDTDLGNFFMRYYVYFNPGITFGYECIYQPKASGAIVFLAKTVEKFYNFCVEDIFDQHL